MLRFLLLVVALALYGGYSLIHSFATPASAPAQAVAVQPAPATQASPFSTHGAIDLVANATSGFTGLKLLPLPDTGCSPSALPPEKAQAMVESLPQAQQMALAKLLNMSASVWTIQLYDGVHGAGFCLPAHDKLVVLPGIALPSQESLTEMVQGATAAQ